MADNRAGPVYPSSSLHYQYQDPTSSVALLLRAQNGDNAARNELCARYLPRLRRWAHGRVPIWARDHLDTDDFVQETLVKSFQRLEHFTPRDDQAFWAYVCEAMRNRVRDAVRDAARRPHGEGLPDFEPTPGPSPLEFAVEQETLRRYDDALIRLRESDRELIVARVELGLNYAEIATLTGRPSASAARVAISRALLRLAMEMGLDRQG
jgi:RNA polymerase sigma-70 factor (ECF subfamily)